MAPLVCNDGVTVREKGGDVVSIFDGSGGVPVSLSKDDRDGAGLGSAKSISHVGAGPIVRAGD